jgi:hypothetical protein
MQRAKVRRRRGRGSTEKVLEYHTRTLEEKMKRLLCLAVTVLALALITSPIQAAASSCSNATIRGTYAFTLRGQILLPDGSSIVLDGLAKQTFDGRGNFTQVDAVAENGVLAPGWRPGSGTYSVNPNCTGTQTISVTGLPDVHLQFIISQSGNKIRQVVTDPGLATTAEGERVVDISGK